jgi:hypothetical protein
MRIFLLVFSIVAISFTVLDAFCQQADNGDSVFNWQVKAPPSAPGYGSSPFESVDPNKQKTTSPPPLSEHEPPHKQPVAEKKVTEPSKPILTIEPPPSAPGYGIPYKN